MEWTGMTPAQAEALAIGMVEGARMAEQLEQEEFVPGCDGPGACPDEWQPVGHEPPAPRRTGMLAEWTREI